MSVAVGKNIERVDGYGKVTGQAAYTGDLNIPGMIHGKVLRSPHAHARLVKIDGRRLSKFRECWRFSPARIVRWRRPTSAP